MEIKQEKQVILVFLSKPRTRPETISSFFETRSMLEGPEAPAGIQPSTSTVTGKSEAQTSCSFEGATTNRRNGFVLKRRAAAYPRVPAGRSVRPVRSTSSMEFSLYATSVPFLKLVLGLRPVTGRELTESLLEGRRENAA